MSKYSKPITDFDECPHCFSDYGYYQTFFVSGKIQISSDFQGNANCSETYDYLNWRKPSMYFFCCQCGQRIAKVNDEKINLKSE